MKKIYILEPDPDILEIVSFVLQDAGYTVKSAKNTSELSQLISGQTPDAILLDVISPSFEEALFCEQLKASPLTKRIPIVVLSTDSRIKQNRKTLRADDVIAKPFDIKEIVSSLKYLLPA